MSRPRQPPTEHWDPRARTSKPASAAPARFVFSIAPVHVEAILNGRKRWEFRRVRARVLPGDEILVYATAPVGAVVAKFTAGDVRHGPAAELVALETDAHQRRVAREYLSGAHVGTAIQVSAPASIPSLPISAATGLSRAPMSYQRIPD